MLFTLLVSTNCGSGTGWVKVSGSGWGSNRSLVPLLPCPFPPFLGARAGSSHKWTSGGNLHFGCSPRRRSDRWLSLLDLLPPCYIYEPGQLCLLRFSLISPRNIKKLILPILQCIAASKFLSSALTCSVSLAPPLPLLKYQSQTPEIKSEEESAEGHSSQRAIKTFLAHSCIPRFRFERWGRVISCCIGSTRQTMLNNYRAGQQSTKSWHKKQDPAKHTIVFPNCWQPPSRHHFCLMVSIEAVHPHRKMTNKFNYSTKKNCCQQWWGSTGGGSAKQSGFRPEPKAVGGRLQKNVIWWSSCSCSSSLYKLWVLFSFLCSGGTLRLLSKDLLAGGGVNE